MTDSLRRFPRFALLSLATSLALVSVGCASGPTDLTVTSLRNHQTFEQPFSQAYAGRSDQGDFEAVLVSEGAADSDAPGVRQVMHVRMLWKPMKGTKLDHPTATNATIDWYVLDPRPEAGGLIAYTGAGFVSVATSGNTAKLDIRNATLRPTTRQGGMTDPIGPAKLQGTVVATMGRWEKARDLLARAETQTAHASAARAAAAREASSRTPVEP